MFSSRFFPAIAYKMSLLKLDKKRTTYPSKHGKYTEQTWSRALRQRTHNRFTAIANRSPFPETVA